MLCVTDPVEIARLEARIVGRKSPQTKERTEVALECRSQASGERRASAGQIHVDDRLGIAVKSIEAAIGLLPAGCTSRLKSKLEEGYSRQLEAQRLAGLIRRWWYEPATFRLPGGHWYTPDFVIELSDGRFHWVETKGHMWKHDKLRIDAFREIWSSIALEIVHSAHA